MRLFKFFDFSIAEPVDRVRRNTYKNYALKATLLRTSFAILEHNVSRGTGALYNMKSA
jgi:hypothetical protein